MGTNTFLQNIIRQHELLLLSLAIAWRSQISVKYFQFILEHKNCCKLFYFVKEMVSECTSVENYHGHVFSALQFESKKKQFSLTEISGF